METSENNTNTKCGAGDSSSQLPCSDMHVYQIGYLAIAATSLAQALTAGEDDSDYAKHENNRQIIDNHGYYSDMEDWENGEAQDCEMIEQAKHQLKQGETMPFIVAHMFE